MADMLASSLRPQCPAGYRHVARGRVAGEAGDAWRRSPTGRSGARAGGAVTRARASQPARGRVHVSGGLLVAKSSRVPQMEAPRRWPVRKDRGEPPVRVNVEIYYPAPAGCRQWEAYDAG